VRFRAAFLVSLLAFAPQGWGQEFSCQQLSACGQYGTDAGGYYPYCACGAPNTCSAMTHFWSCKYFAKPGEFVDAIECSCDYVGPAEQQHHGQGFCEQYKCFVAGDVAREDGYGGCVCPDQLAPPPP
jgi:hypothetical protein